MTLSAKLVGLSGVGEDVLDKSESQFIECFGTELHGRYIGESAYFSFAALKPYLE